MRPSLNRVAACGATLALVAVALTGCATAGSSDGCTPRVTSGPASETISATGAFGSAPNVRFPNPMHVSDTEVSTVIPGHGAPLSGRQLVVADVTFLDGTTGAAVTRTEYSGAASAARFVVGTVPIPGLQAALTCARVGSRVAAVMPPSQGIPAANRPAGLNATASLVAVVDIRKAYLARADGADQVMAGGLPAVVLGADGRPGITLPEGDPPKTLSVADLKRGSGAAVKRGDSVVVQYTGVVWKPGDPADGTVFDSSWTAGTPATFKVQDGQIVKGLVTGLTGRRVGSQVLAVLPASQAYGSQSTSSVPAGATLVFVVDILGKA